MKKNICKIIIIFIIGAVGGIFSNQILWPFFIERPLFSQYNLEAPTYNITERKEVIIQENTALQDAVEKVEKAVVGISTQTVEGRILEGSGLIVSSDGMMVTLADLVPQGSDFSFIINGKKVSYQILKRDIRENLALVKLEEKNLPTVGFADLEKVRLGQRAFLVGIIFETATSSQKSAIAINEGIIKSFNEDYIFTNISENIIFSGSPLFNIAGEALGLSIIKDGEVFTIPISKIKKFIGF